jgi:hypothetical protein
LHVWGCPAEAKIFNPAQGKLDDRTHLVVILLATLRDRRVLDFTVQTDIQSL